MIDTRAEAARILAVVDDFCRGEVDTYQEHLDSQPDESRWDGFDRGDPSDAEIMRREAQREADALEFGHMTFAEASALAKRYGALRIKHKLVRIADGVFDVVVTDHSHER